MPTPAVNISEEIRRANDSFEASFMRGDAAAIAGLFTHSGALLPTGMDTIRGAGSIQTFWQSAMAMGISKVKLKTRDIEELDGTAIELGTYTLFGSNDQQVDQGKYLVVWKEETGQWKLHHEIWNTSRPSR